MMNDDPIVNQAVKKQTGSYQTDPPKEFSHQGWETVKQELGLTDDSLRKKILILGDHDPSYDCFNWSLGYRQNAEKNVPSTEDEVDDLYATYGFKRTNNPPDAKIAVYAGNNRAIHVAVKRTITYEGSACELWTSKLGTELLISHPQAKTIVKYYPNAQVYWLYE